MLFRLTRPREASALQVSQTTALTLSLTVLIYSASVEKGSVDDLYWQLRPLGLETPRLQKNPVTYDWVLVSDFWRDHAKAMALGLLLSLWIKQRKGRRIEIQRPDLKVKGNCLARKSG